MERPDLEKKEISETPENESGEEKDCFKCRLKSFGDFYLHLVVGIGVLLATAIWLGVKVHVMAGLGLAIAAVCAYAICVGEVMRKKLGLAYTRVSEGVSLSVIAPKGSTKWGREKRYIPSRILWLDVVAIGGRTEKQKADETVTTVYIPTSVKRIEKDAFEGMTALTAVVYEGTEEEWKEVEDLSEIQEILRFEN